MELTAPNIMTLKNTATPPAGSGTGFGKAASTSVIVASSKIDFFFNSS